MSLAWGGLLALALSATANPDLASAEEAFAGGEYQRVLPLTERALASTLATADAARALELQAFTHAAFDQSTAAIAAFRRLLLLSPDYRLPPEVSPKVVGLFQEAQRLSPHRAAAQLAGGEVSAAPEVPVWKRWWVWGAAAVVVAGASTAVAWGVTQPPVPSGNLGTRTLP